MVGNICGLATPLTPVSPENGTFTLYCRRPLTDVTELAKVVDIVIATWSITISGVFIGLIAGPVFTPPHTA